MEILGLFDLPIWLVACLLLILTIIVYTVYKRSIFSRMGIKTKPSTFLIGDFGKMAKEGMTIYSVDTARQYGKVFGTFWGNMPMMVVSDTDVIREMLVKQFSDFTERIRFKSKPKAMNSSVSVAEGTHWKYLRSTLSPSFTSGKLRKMNRHVSGCLENLHLSIQDQASEHPDGFDMFPTLRAYTMDVICKVGFGVDVDSQRNPNNAFVENAKGIVNSDFARNPIVILNVLFPDLPFLEKVEIEAFPKGPGTFFRQAAKSMFEERKKSDTTHVDLLQTMMNAHKEDDNEAISARDRTTQSIEELKRKGLTDDEVITNSLVFMVAGFETTSTTLAWLTYDLAVNTECQDKLIEEIDRDLGESLPDYESVFKLAYLDQVVSESLRMHPAAQILTRQAVRDTEVCGIPIPNGMCILMPASILHFLPEYWEDPHEYKPERFAPENKDKLNEYAYIPFGIGPRNCIGMRLAQLEVKMTVVSLLQKYRIVKTDKLMVPMEGTKKGFYKPAKPVHVKLEKRK